MGSVYCTVFDIGDNPLMIIIGWKNCTDEGFWAREGGVCEGAIGSRCSGQHAGHSECGLRLPAMTYEAFRVWYRNACMKRARNTIHNDEAGRTVSWFSCICYRTSHAS